MEINRKRVFVLVAVVTLILNAQFSFTQETGAVRDDLGQLSGKIMLDGKPFPYGFVAFFAAKDGQHQDYNPTSKRSPAMVAFIEENGVFSTQPFPVGSYYIGAMMRKRWVGGPPKAGEKRYSATGEKGDYPVFTVKQGELIDVGVVNVIEPKDFPELTEYMTVEGRVVDEEGRGILGAVVVAKKDLNDPKGLFISAETAMNGAYQLKIPPGRYFFVARQALTRAGRPKPGGLMGTLGHTKPVGLGGKSEEPPAFLAGASGQEFTNIDIPMFKIPVPDVRRKEVEADVQAKRIDKNSLPDNLPLRKNSNTSENAKEYKAEEKSKK